jgi:hypothetical protein
MVGGPQKIPAGFDCPPAIRSFVLWAAFGSPDFGCGPGQVKASLVCLIANLAVDFSEGDDFKKGPDSLAQVHHVWAREM